MYIVITTVDLVSKDTDLFILDLDKLDLDHYFKRFIDEALLQPDRTKMVNRYLLNPDDIIKLYPESLKESFTIQDRVILKGFDAVSSFKENLSRTLLTT